MQILIQGSSRRVRLTKGEVRKLDQAMQLAGELAGQHPKGEPALVALEGLLSVIDSKGYLDPPKDEDKE